MFKIFKSKNKQVRNLCKKDDTQRNRVYSILSVFSKPMTPSEIYQKHIDVFDTPLEITCIRRELTRLTKKNFLEINTNISNFKSENEWKVKTNQK